MLLSLWKPGQTERSPIFDKWNLVNVGSVPSLSESLRLVSTPVAPGHN
jgi:hypothetical protein